MRRDSREYYNDMGWTAEWDFDPVITIGGCKHGEVLRKSESTFSDLLVPRPLDLTAAVFTAEPPVMPSLDDQVERYRVHRFVIPSRRPGLTAEVFPVYVEASMPLDEAQVWLQLLMASIRALCTLTLMGLRLRHWSAG